MELTKFGNIGSCSIVGLFYVFKNEILISSVSLIIFLLDILFAIFYSHIAFLGIAASKYVGYVKNFTLCSTVSKI